jgi:hypothetical protein
MKIRLLSNEKLKNKLIGSVLFSKLQTWYNDLLFGVWEQTYAARRVGSPHPPR